MSNRLTRPDVIVLLRVAGLLTVIWSIPGSLGVPKVWEEVRQQQAFAAAGMMPQTEARWAWVKLATLAWPLLAGGGLLLAASPLSRLVVRGLPGPHACPGCGYDLSRTATGRCPECGLARDVPGGSGGGGHASQ